MPKFRLYSDTHLDWYARDGVKAENFWYPPVLPDDKETTLILAGDIWTGTSFIEVGGFSWVKVLSERFKQVLVVLGNHDYWPFGDFLTIQHGGDKCNALLQDMGLHNVKVLDCLTHEDGDVLYIGATLWTDIGKGHPWLMHQMGTSLSYDGKIAYWADYKGSWKRWTSELWVREHDRHKKYIELVAKQNPDKKIVVITHHAPLTNITSPHFVGNFMNAYYVSDLSDLILDNENIVLWCFGHTHHPIDVQVGNCRVLNNPVGYQGEHFEQQGLVEHRSYNVGEIGGRLR